MNKKMLRKDFFMEIKRSLGRFLSIFFIVAIGVAFFSGIRSSEPDMRISGDSYFDKQKLMDIKVISTLGLTDDDIEALESLNCVEEVEHGYSVDALCTVQDSKRALHIMSMQDTMNQVVLEEGTMPVKSDECLVDASFLKDSDYKIGDTISFTSGTKDDLSDTLVNTEFKITGSASSPMYISFSRGNTTIGTGHVNGFVCVPEEAFDMDIYTELYVRVKDADAATEFTKAYDDIIDGAKDEIDGIKDERQKARYNEIVDEATEKLNDAKKELEDAKLEADEQLADALKELEDGQSKIDDGRIQIIDGESQISSNRDTLLSKREEIKKGFIELADKEKELNDGEALLQDGREQYDAGYAKYTQGKSDYETGLAQYEAGKADYDKGKAELEEGKAQYEAGKVQYEEGKAQYEAGLSQYNAGLAEYNTKKAEYDAAKAQYAQLNQQLQDLIASGLTDPETTATIAGLQQTLAAMDAQFAVAEPELQTAKATLDATKTTLDTTKTTLDASKEELDKSEIVLGASELKLAKAAETLAETKTKLDEAKGVLASTEKTLADSKKALDDNAAQITSGKSQMEEARVQLQEGKTAVENGLAILIAKESDIAASKADLDSAQAEVDDGYKEYYDAKADAEKEIADAEKEIADAEDEIQKIENAKWYIDDRSDLPEHGTYGENADRMKAIGKVFPVLFFLVAALISLTTMTRMVEDERVQIGTLKALGYSRRLIAAKYLGYAGLATLGGSIVGILIGEKILPFIIIYAYGIMFPYVNEIIIPYNMYYGLMAGAAAFGCTMLATYFSCNKEMKEQAAQLMRPPSPKQGKRVFMEKLTFIWKHLSFIWKATVRNLIRYKKRFFMTVFGIGGCMALLLVGFGLKDSISNIALLQYNEIQLYDATVILESDATDDEKKEIKEHLDKDKRVENTIDNLLVNITLNNDNLKQDVYLNVPSDVKKFDEFVKYNDRLTNKQYKLDDDGVILTEKSAELLDVKAGDTVVIKDDVKGEIEVKISEVCENYLGHFMYMTPNLYEKLYGKEPVFNSVYYKLYEDKKDEITNVGEDVLKLDGALSISYTDSLREQIDNMLGSLDIVIVVLVISAGMLAFVVLYNLNNINITERQRELATLKVLGFYDKEVAAYVYRENIILSIIGALFGSVLGKFLHGFVIKTVEIESAMFGRNIDFSSFVYGFIITMGFSLFVNFVMYFKLKRIDMVESLKSVE